MTELQKQNLKCAFLWKRNAQVDCMVENVLDSATERRNVFA